MARLRAFAQAALWGKPRGPTLQSLHLNLKQTPRLADFSVRKSHSFRAKGREITVTEAIDNLISENREDTYNALSILFVMAKTGEVHPLVQAIERHESVQVRMAAIKLLTLTGQSDIANTAAKRRLEGHS